MCFSYIEDNVKLNPEALQSGLTRLTSGLNTNLLYLQSSGKAGTGVEKDLHFQCKCK